MDDPSGLERTEKCDNPDHGFIEAMGGELRRLGCPCCGHNPGHIISTPIPTSEALELLGKVIEARDRWLLKTFELSEFGNFVWKLFDGVSKVEVKG